jgi:hypothetical protein
MCSSTIVFKIVSGAFNVRGKQWERNRGRLTYGTDLRDEEQTAARGNYRWKRGEINRLSLLDRLSSGIP